MSFYAPLDPSRDELRVISIAPAARSPSNPDSDDLIPDEHIRCTLKVVSLQDLTPAYREFRNQLNEGSSRPHEYCELWEEYIAKDNTMGDEALTTARFTWGDYETLSYVWNNGSNNTYTIFINREPTLVMENLYFALQEFRRTQEFSRGRVLWVDALCINQTDLDERSREVRRMKDIYDLSARSVVWLGRTLNIEGMNDEFYFDRLNPILEFISRLQRIWDSSNDGESSDADGPTFDESTSDALEEELECSDRSQGQEELRELLENSRSIVALDGAIHDLSAITKLSNALSTIIHPLLRLSYWKRVWIIQELAFSSNHTILCVGKSTVYLSHLFDVTQHLTRAYQRHLISFSWTSSDMDTLMLFNHVHSVQTYGDGHLWYFNWLEYGIFARATLSSDKLYGLLGLLDTDISEGIMVDYKKSSRQASIDFSRVMIEVSRALRNFMIRPEFGTHNTPSWAPDPSLHHTYTQSIPFPLLGDTDTDAARLDWDTFCHRQSQEGNDEKLIVGGILLDKIDGVGACSLPDVSFLSSDVKVGTVLRVVDIDCSIKNPTIASHSYEDDQQMLGFLSAALTKFDIYDTSEFDSDETLTTVFDLPFLAVEHTVDQTGTSIPAVERASKDIARRLLELKQFVDLNQNFRIWETTLGSLFPRYGSQDKEVWDRARESQKRAHGSPRHAGRNYDGRKPKHLENLQQMRLVTTFKGYLGRAALLTRHGDHVYRLEGCDDAVILRPTGDEFEFVGLAKIASLEHRFDQPGPDDFTFDRVVKIR